MEKSIINKIKNKNKSKYALTNEVFFGKYNNIDVVLKIYNINNFKYTNIDNELNIFNIVKNNINTPEIIEFIPKKYLITKYLNSKSFHEIEFTSDHIIKIANEIKALHNINISKTTIKTFDVIKKIYEYKKNIPSINDKEIIEKVIDYLNNFKEYVLCHNDLVPGNIIYSNKKIFIIDFEFSGLNDPYFDIASFFTESNISQKNKKIFLNSYFDNGNYNKEILNMWIKFNNVLWYYWAKNNYKQNNKIIYKNIAEEKLDKINNNTYLDKK